MKLYSTALSPNGKRVRVCAAELGLISLGLAASPNIRRWRARLAPRPSWKAADPARRS